MIKKVYICSPLGGNVRENLEKVKRYTKYALPVSYTHLDVYKRQW